jgi:hypothetical protein
MLWSIQYADGRTGELALSEHGLLGARVTISSPLPPASTLAATPVFQM